MLHRSSCTSLFASISRNSSQSSCLQGVSSGRYSVAGLLRCGGLTKSTLQPRRKATDIRPNCTATTPVSYAEGLQPIIMMGRYLRRYWCISTACPEIENRVEG
ncbi:hypothetical protein BDV10DRAFT_14634 [Aspergillus recurvatus]